MLESSIVSPVFLVGAERSGTTLLRLMLSHHPQLAWCSEFEYAVDQIPSEGWPQLSEYYEWLETNRIFQSTNFSIDLSLDYPQLMHSFLEQELTQTGKEIVGATVHRSFDKLLRIWPDARFIHLLRDGRDVASSCINMGWAGNLWVASERWIEAENLWKSISDELPQDRWIQIHYESLIADPQDTLVKICAFIGIDYHPAMLSYHLNSSYHVPDASYSQKWRSTLSQDKVCLIESRIAEMLVERGYELSGFPPTKTHSWRKQWFRVQDWWFRLSFRIRHFGLGLVVAEYVIRKGFGSRSLYQKVWKQMQARKAQYIK